MDFTIGKLEVRKLKYQDLEQIITLTREQGWSTTFTDVRNLSEAYRDAFEGAFDEDGLLLSACIAFEVDDHKAYVSHFITRKTHQGKGIGGQLFRNALNRLEKYNILLHAVIGTEDMYTRYGFSKTNLQVRKMACLVDMEKVELQLKGKKNVTVQIDSSNLDQVCKYDRSVAGFDRGPYIKVTVHEPDTLSRCIIDGGMCAGYIQWRKIKDGYRCHTFYAESVENAKMLLFESLYQGKFKDKESLVFFLPQDNEEAIEMLLGVLGEYTAIEKSDSVKFSERLMYTKVDISESFNFDKVFSINGLI